MANHVAVVVVVSLCYLMAILVVPSWCVVPNIQDVVVHPEILKIGGQARLLCMVANVVPGVQVFWTKTDTQNVISADGVIKADTFDESNHLRKYDIIVYKLDESSGVKVYELTIHKLQMLDGGRYKCSLYIPGYVSQDDLGRIAQITIVGKFLFYHALCFFLILLNSTTSNKYGSDETSLHHLHWRSRGEVVV